MIFFFNGEFLRKLLVMFPRSFRVGDRRRRVDRKHHRRRNHSRSSISCGGDSTFTLALSFFFSGGRSSEERRSCRTLGLTAVFFGPSRTEPIPRKSNPARPATLRDVGSSAQARPATGLNGSRTREEPRTDRTEIVGSRTSFYRIANGLKLRRVANGNNLLSGRELCVLISGRDCAEYQVANGLNAEIVASWNGLRSSIAS
ncbi:hypothetical protein Bca4012_052147 [Brassica carinata]